MPALWVPLPDGSALNVHSAALVEPMEDGGVSVMLASGAVVELDGAVAGTVRVAVGIALATTEAPSSVASPPPASPQPASPDQTGPAPAELDNQALTELDEEQTRILALETFEDMAKRAGLLMYGFSALLATVGSTSHRDLARRQLEKITEAITKTDADGNDVPDTEAASGFNENGFVTYASGQIAAAPKGRKRSGALTAAIEKASEHFGGDRLAAVKEALARAATS